MKYHYFVSFTFTYKGSVNYGYGNNAFVLPSKIDSYEKVMELSKMIQKELQLEQGQVVVLNFTLLKEEETKEN